MADSADGATLSDMAQAKDILEATLGLWSSSPPSAPELPSSCSTASTEASTAASTPSGEELERRARASMKVKSNSSPGPKLAGRSRTAFVGVGSSDPHPLAGEGDLRSAITTPRLDLRINEGETGRRIARGY
jgi:hypothetical protein